MINFMDNQNIVKTMYIDVKIVELPLLHHPAYSLATTHRGSHNGTANGPHGWSRPPANNHAVYSMQSGWRGKYSFGDTYNLDFVFDISVLCGMSACVWSHIALQPSSIFILILFIRGRLQNVVSRSNACSVQTQKCLSSTTFRLNF